MKIRNLAVLDLKLIGSQECMLKRHVVSSLVVMFLALSEVSEGSSSWRQLANLKMSCYQKAHKEYEYRKLLMRICSLV